MMCLPAIQISGFTKEATNKSKNGPVLIGLLRTRTNSNIPKFLGLGLGLFELVRSVRRTLRTL